MRLQEQPFHFLELLLEKRGTVVSRTEIQERLWPGNTFVDFDKSLGVAVLKVREALEDDAGHPRFVETVPRRGFRFIAPVMVEGTVVQEAPAGAATPGELLAAGPSKNLETGVAVGAETTAAKPVAVFLGGGRWLAVTAAAICILGALIFGLFRAHSKRGVTSPVSAPAATTVPAIQPRRSVAVLGFRSLPQMSQNEWLSTAFSEMLNTELAAGGKLRLISGEDVARVKREILLTPEATLSKNTLSRLRTNLGADVVLLGSYTMLSGKNKSRIRLDVRLQDTALGETIEEQAFIGSEDDLFDLASQAGVQLREELSPESRLAPAVEIAKVSAPSNQLALQLYSEGLARLYAFDFMGSRVVLQRAVAADPNYPLTHAVLAETLTHLGYTREARAEAKRALDQSHVLSKEEGLVIRGQYEETEQDWAAAANTYQALFYSFPDNVDYGLRLASVQRRTDQSAALNTLATLRKQSSAHREDPRIDLMEASALANRDLAGGRAAAQRAISVASARGETLTVARGYGILCQEGGMSGDNSEQSIRECNTARASYVLAGDRNNAARTLNDLAGIYYLRGDVTHAVSSWREALSDFNATGDAEGMGAVANNLGATLLLQGDLPGARRMLEESLSTAQAIGDKDGVARVLSDLGGVSMERGDLRGAQVYYRHSTAVASAINDKSAAAFGMEGMADVLVEQADFAAAKTFYQESVRMRTEVGEKETIAETSIQLARLAIEEGHASDVVESLRQVRQQSHLEHQQDDELTAALMRTRAFVAERKIQDATTEIAGLKSLADTTQNRLLALRFAYTSALVESAGGDGPGAESALTQVLAQARAHDFRLFSDEVSLALAKTELQTNPGSSSQANLLSLERSFRSKGLYLLARGTAQEP